MQQEGNTATPPAQATQLRPRCQHEDPFSFQEAERGSPRPASTPPLAPWTGQMLFLYPPSPDGPNDIFVNLCPFLLATPPSRWDRGGVNQHSASRNTQSLESERRLWNPGRACYKTQALNPRTHHGQQAPGCSLVPGTQIGGKEPVLEAKESGFKNLCF